jgi:hypothetical protein
VAKTFFVDLGFHTCKAGALLLEPYLQSILEMGSL